jgi:hypothetical protein
MRWGLSVRSGSTTRAPRRSEFERDLVRLAPVRMKTRPAWATNGWHPGDGDTLFAVCADRRHECAVGQAARLVVLTRPMDPHSAD